MSRENVEAIRATYEALNRHDLDAVLSDASPDFELIPLPGMIVADWFSGHAGAREFWSLPFEAFDEIQIEPTEGFIDAGDAIVVAVRWQGRGRDGITVDQRLVDVWTFRDGLKVRLQGFATKREALEAAGLSE